MSKGLRGCQEIADYLRVSRPTALKLIHERGLPAWLTHRKGGATVFVTTTDIVDSWIITQDKLRRERDAGHAA